MSEEENDRTLFVKCDCGWIEHQMVLNYLHFEDEPEKQAYLHVHLAQQNVLRRILYAIKYIFGYQCKYGAFQEIVLNEKSLSDIKDFINFIQDKTKIRKLPSPSA